MTNPANAHATEQGRYYVHPLSGETWPSVTNCLDTAVNKPALVPWAAKVTAEYALEHLPELVRRARRDREQLLKDVKAQVRFVKDTAADLGSRVHAYAEAHVLGKAVEDDPEVEPFATQLLAWFTTMGIRLDPEKGDVVAAEATIINRTHGYAGTGDLWVNLRIAPDLSWSPRKRWLWLIDYKTSSTRPATSVYPEHGMQVAAIANAETLLLDDGTEVEPPGPIAGTAVLNLRTRGYALMPVPANRDEAFAAFCAALQTTKYLHGVAKDKPQPWTIPAKDVA
jgi:hypothetical protein